MTQLRTAPARAWRVRDEPQHVPEGDWPPLIGRLLALRGLTTSDAARAFLGETPAAVPTLPDIDAAVERLVRACNAGETVAVYGDFDVDGITSAVLLTEGLAAVGARPVPYLPHRVEEGYGLNNRAIDTLADLGATLLVTADCGTSSVHEIAHAGTRGMDTVILDHHTIPPLLPSALAIVNPKCDPSVRDEPAACGIAYYVLCALYDAMGRTADDASMLELAALGTVCDLAPLVGDNRRVVREGLRAIARTERAGLRALIEVAGCDRARVDTEAAGYALGPRLNAAGRLAHARVAFDLLTARDEETARELAQELDRLNRERQQATEIAFALAGDIAAEEPDAPLIMVGHEELPAGIVGLVASRLVEARNRPAVVYERGEDESRASARSISGYDITGALRTCPELFVRFGGHRMAAGFTARNEMLPAIKERLLAHAGAELAEKDLTPALHIDAELPLASLRGEEIRWLSRLAPHGIGNAQPRFLSRNVLVAERKSIGSDGQHLRLKLRDGAVVWPAIAFGNDGDGIETGEHVDAVYTLSADRMVSDGLELRVLDVRPAGSSA